MDWQLALTAVIVLLATAYLGRRAWRTWRGRAAGCGACRCPGSSPENAEQRPAADGLIPSEQLTARLRRPG